MIKPVKNLNSAQSITVYYDGGCPICQKEISHYQGLIKTRAINWLDISKGCKELTQLGITQKQALSSLHVSDNFGNVYTGVDSFIQIWLSLKRYQIIGRLASLPLIKQSLQVLYQLITFFRLKWRCRKSR